MVQGLGPDDLVLALISGGGSALLSLPAPGLTLEDKQAVNAALLRSGAPIGEMNCVRKHLSAIKGGRLAAAAYPARVVTLVISDVPGDDPSAIASGPTVPDPTTFADARAILAKYGITSPRRRDRASGARPRTRRRSRATRVSPGAETRDDRDAADGARGRRRGRANGGRDAAHPRRRIEGEAREVGKVMAGIALQVALRGQPARPPCVLLSGGETTVTVRGGGRGGRNVEFLLSLARRAGRTPGVFAIAGDTDGVDGAEEIAGALITPDTLARAAAQGINAKERLADNDGHGFFEALGDQVVTGPTLTNVNDFRAILITSQRRRRKPPDEPCDVNATPRSSRPSGRRVEPGGHPHAVRGGRRRVSPQLQPRHARGPPASATGSSAQIEQETGRPIGVLVDLQGPKLRVGTFADGRVTPARRASRSASISTPSAGRPSARHACRIPRSSRRSHPGVELLLDDGKIRLAVESVRAEVTPRRAS